MWPLGVVMVEPGHQRQSARLRTGIGAGIDPLAQAGLDKPLGLAVGSRGVGPGAFVFEAGRRDCAAESVAAIGCGRLLQPGRPTLPLAEPRERVAEVGLGLRLPGKCGSQARDTRITIVAAQPPGCS